MDFPSIIPTATVSAEQRQASLGHSIFAVQSTWRAGHTLYIKRLNGPIDQALNMQERWMLADMKLRPGPDAAVAEKPYHSERRRFLIAWNVEALQSRKPVLPARRSSI